MAVPVNRFHYEGEADVVRLAISLLFAIAKKQVFLQGNKRTAMDAALMFLESNGYMLTLANTETLADWIVAVIEGRMSLRDFEEAFKPYVAQKRT
jgi:death-on-curing protein